MSSQTFTPSSVVDMAKERDWAASIGMMDWDNTSIVFTKRSLIQFLKYTGTTVDTNFQNISKLPKYATFGKISGGEPKETSTEESASSAQTSVQSTDSFRPTRRVRQGPGGDTHNIFEDEFPDDALALAPGTQKPTDSAPPPPSSSIQESIGDEPVSGSNGIRPSRRVRTAPGGKDSIASLWGDDEPAEEEFKPTRRVRQGPGGQDSVGSLFG